MKSDFSNWSDLRVFLAVLREGSTLAASRCLAIAQPTVARRIGVLEHTLGLSLFERDTQGFRPTEEGLKLRPFAEQIEAQILEFASEATRLQHSGDHVIRITATPEDFSEGFAAILGEFSAENPSVTFEFIPSVTTMNLSDGEADIAIRYAQEIPDPTLICRKLYLAHAALYASKSYIAKFGKPKSERDLAEHQFVVLDSQIMQPFKEWLDQRIEPDQIAMRCSDFNGLMAAIHAGFGIGPLGVGLGERSEALVQCLPPPEGLGVQSWLLISAQAHRRSEVRAFTAFFAPRYIAMIKQQRAERAKKRAADTKADALTELKHTP